MRLILKNLWKRRKQNVWLSVELVLVSIVCWFVIDPLFVIAYHAFGGSDGYDADRLVILTTHSKGKNTIEPATASMGVEGIKAKLRNMEEVECVSLTYQRYYPNGDAAGLTSYFGIPDDTVRWTVGGLLIARRGEDMYRTLGLKVVDGSIEDEGIIITQGLALTLFGRTDVAGAMMVEYHNDPWVATPEQMAQYKIAAVVEDYRVSNMMYCRHGAFREYERLYVGDQEELLVRLKEGVDATDFCKRIRPTMQKELSSDSLFVCKVQTMNELIDNRLRYQSVTGSIRRYISLAVFFMANLCLGTIGTFWLQTRKRKGEIGIMRSFGASRGRIMRSFLLEGFVLTLVSHLIGCFMFFQYAVSNGLSVGVMGDRMRESLSRMSELWLNDFWPHFMAVGTGIYLIIFSVVSVGIAIPVWNICRMKPVEALRDE